MKRKWALYGRLNEWLGDFEIDAESKQEALAKLKLEHPFADKCEAVVPGGDLGVCGIN